MVASRVKSKTASTEKNTVVQVTRILFMGPVDRRHKIYVCFLCQYSAAGSEEIKVRKQAVTSTPDICHYRYYGTVTSVCCQAWHLH